MNFRAFLSTLFELFQALPASCQRRYIKKRAGSTVVRLAEGFPLKSCTRPSYDLLEFLDFLVFPKDF